MDGYKAVIREFFGRFFPQHGLGDSEDIFAGGFVNSLFAMQLIAWLENEFGLAIEDQDLRVENFNSVNAIGSLIARKTSARAPAPALA